MTARHGCRTRHRAPSRLAGVSPRVRALSADGGFERLRGAGAVGDAVGGAEGHSQRPLDPDQGLPVVVVLGNAALELIPIGTQAGHALPQTAAGRLAALFHAPLVVGIDGVVLPVGRLPARVGVGVGGAHHARVVAAADSGADQIAGEPRRKVAVACVALPFQ